MWVANFFDNSLTKLAVSDCGSTPDVCGQSLGTIEVDDLPVALAFDGDNLWVASSLEQTVSAVSPASGEVIGRYALPHVPSALAWDGESLWSANAIAGTVTKIASDGQILADIEVGKGPVAIAFDGASLWVINQEGKSLVRIEPDAARVLETIALDGVPAAVALDGATLWIGLSDVGQSHSVRPGGPVGPSAHRSGLVPDSLVVRRRAVVGRRARSR